jgi:hypothetical protein
MLSRFNRGNYPDSTVETLWALAYLKWLLECREDFWQMMKPRESVRVECVHHTCFTREGKRGWLRG